LERFRGTEVYLGLVTGFQGTTMDTLASASAVPPTMTVEAAAS